MTATAARGATNARGRYPARALHVVDIENLAGTALPDTATVAALRALYGTRVPLGAQDQIVVACNDLALVDVGLGWGCREAQYRVRSGPDGADLELLDVLQFERVAERFTQVVIASGDGAFAVAAAALAARGCHVTVVSRRESLSARLALAVNEIRYIDSFEPVSAAALASELDAA